MHGNNAWASVACIALSLSIVRHASATTVVVQTPSATIEGRVRNEQLQGVDGAAVRVVDRATGYTLQAISHNGRFVIAGLRVGGPYRLTIQHPAYAVAHHDSIFLTVAEHRFIDVDLAVSAVAMDTLYVNAAQGVVTGIRAAGTTTIISDSMVHRLPSSDRNYYEFALLSPHLSGRSVRTGISGGGVNIRLNNFLMDGVSERGLLGNFAAGTGQTGKAIPIDAVREYQVLLSPYDVRYSDFVGALLNAVTKSGGNDWSGSAFLYARNDELARNTALLRRAPYERTQLGFTVSGPIIRNQAHFFIASELQEFTTPAAGPYFTDDPATLGNIAVSQLTLTRFSDILKGHGIEAGSAGRVEIDNPLRNLFAKVDVALPRIDSRLVVFSNYAHTESAVFSRGTSVSILTRPSPGFALSSTGFSNRVSKHVVAAQLYTSLGGAFNELTIAAKLNPSRATPFERAPMISVRVPRAVAAGVVLLEAGSNEAAHGVGVEQSSFEIGDHLTLLSRGSHHFAVGARAELFKVSALGQAGAYGSWLFSSLDSLRDGNAERFYVVKRSDDEAERRYFVQLGFYFGDEWQPSERVKITFGLRADLLRYADRPSYNALVDTLFARRNSNVPSPVHWSPRVGFNLRPGGDIRTSVRGGLGVFVGRPGVGWLARPITNHGHGTGALECGPRAQDSGPSPAFVSDYRNVPQSCADGSGITAGYGGAVNLLDHRLRLGQALKASLAVDQALPGNAMATLEALYTRNTSDFLFVNLNLKEPAGVDAHGRVLYGTIDSLGVATRNAVTSRFSEVVELRNQSHNYSLQLVGKLTKQFSHGFEAMASYTHSRVRDVQTPPNAFLYLDNWRLGRVVSGRHDDVSVGISSLEMPHRIVIAATYTAPWRGWATAFSLYYIGEAGTPFTYIAALAPAKGDLNADGTNLNDPIYVPRDARNEAEILFFGNAIEIAAQQDAFDELIENTACLRRQRGSIMRRNSCRTAWVHATNASVRQSLPAIRGKVISAHFDIFNVLNLINHRWGEVQAISSGLNPALLEHMRQTPGSASISQPVFRYQPGRAQFNSDNAESAFQIQLGLRFSF